MFHIVSTDRARAFLVSRMKDSSKRADFAEILLNLYSIILVLNSSKTMVNVEAFKKLSIATYKKIRTSFKFAIVSGKKNTVNLSHELQYLRRSWYQGDCSVGWDMLGYCKMDRTFYCLIAILVFASPRNRNGRTATKRG